MDIEFLKEKTIQFRDERDWKQFHTPKNLAMALSVEAAELAELFLWDDNTSSFETAMTQNEHLQEEMADVLMYFNDIMLCYGITEEELKQTYINKFEKNMNRW